MVTQRSQPAPERLDPPQPWAAPPAAQPWAQPWDPQWAHQWAAPAERAELLERARRIRHHAAQLRQRARTAQQNATRPQPTPTTRHTQPASTADRHHFDVAVHTDTNHTQLQLHGELDLAATPILRQHINNTLDGNGHDGDGGPTTLLIDLTHLHYCDSSGIHTLLTAATQCQHHNTQLRVTGAHGIVRRVLELTHITNTLNVD